jgi:organic hydroperoxide reductase OsmC/OhrA
MAKHSYRIVITWTGNNGTGTSGYRNYSRSHLIGSEGKETIAGSSDANFNGDKTRYNPEELLVASLSSCHMLWYLHLCSQSGVVIVEYVDNATGIMTETNNGGGSFSEVTLYPEITLADESMQAKADELHKKANELCFIANSVNFPVYHKPSYKFSTVLT